MIIIGLVLIVFWTLMLLITVFLEEFYGEDDVND